jgi:hypothetical protein
MSPPAIEWIHLDATVPGALRIGDIVSAAAGGLPIYRVVGLADHEAVLRDEDHAAIRRVPIRRLHWKAGEANGSW